MSIIPKLKRIIVSDHPSLLPYLYMIQRRSFKPICDWSDEKFKKGVMKCFKNHMGYSFDLDNPKTFNEKLQWYKVYYMRDDFGRITDKYLFKSYVAERIGEGYTIPYYNVWTNIDDLLKDWSTLPEEFVLKSNLQANGNHIKFIHKKSSININKLKRELKSWLNPANTLLNSWDWHFYNSEPKILAEAFMSNFKDQLFDYKFFCFNGEPFCVYVAQEHFGEHGSLISFYDMQWNKLDVRYGTHIVGDAQKPKHFDKMVQLAKELSSGFPFVRVDFFDTEEQLYVAELTFTPGGGVTPYYPESFNLLLGEKFILSKE